MSALTKLIRIERWKYQWRYWRGNTPWDTNLTPPEVNEFIADTLPGKALDLGCGTGTNAITLARNGWEVVGVDFAAKAVRKARKKAAAAGLRIRFHKADVTRLDFLDERFDYVLDIGCLFTLEPEDQVAYAACLARLSRPACRYMLYAWLPQTWKGRQRGLSAEAVESLLGGAFTRERVVTGEEKGKPSAWYWYRRR